MSQTLSAKQKKLLDAWYEENKERLTLDGFSVESDDKITDLYFKLLEIKEFESINGVINDYIFWKISDGMVV